MNEYALVSFDSSHEAMASEVILSKRYPTSRLIPTPSQVDAGCGLALRVDFEHMEAAVDILKKEGVIFSKVYHMVGRGNQRKIKEIRSFNL